MDVLAHDPVGSSTASQTGERPPGHDLLVALVRGGKRSCARQCGVNSRCGTSNDNDLRQLNWQADGIGARGNLTGTMAPNEGLGDELTGSRRGLDLSGLVAHGRRGSFHISVEPAGLGLVERHASRYRAASMPLLTMTMVPAIDGKGNGFSCLFLPEIHNLHRFFAQNLVGPAYGAFMSEVRAAGYAFGVEVWARPESIIERDPECSLFCGSGYRSYMEQIERAREH
jgi:hypothetical protein